MERQIAAKKLAAGDRWFYIISYSIVSILVIAVLYPIIYVISASFSSGNAIATGKVWLWPVEFTLDGYAAVFKYKDIWIGYRNSILYTVAGTLINVCMTMICAYPLSRKNLRGRNKIMFLFTFTMLFNGGMLPNYILISKLKMINTAWSLLLPGAISVYNMIVARTFIQSNIPDELLESSRIDGCDDIRFFFKMVLPLSKAILAVLVIWYAVGHWNSYFNAFLYLNDKSKYPLQIYLREILVLGEVQSDMIDGETESAIRNLKYLLKYSTIVVSTVPLYAIYPFIQKYFVKGVMIGSVKG